MGWLLVALFWWSNESIYYWYMEGNLLADSKWERERKTDPSYAFFSVVVRSSGKNFIPLGSMSLYAISAHMKKTSFRILRVSEVPRVILCVIAVNTLVHTAVCLLCVLGVNCHEWLLIHPYIASTKSVKKITILQRKHAPKT